MATVAAALLGSMVVAVVGLDRYEAWYRSFPNSTLFLAIAIITFTTGLAAAVGFRAGTPTLRYTKPTGTLAGVSAGLAVMFFVVITQNGYSGAIWMPLACLAAVVTGMAFYLARLDRKASSNVV